MENTKNTVAALGGPAAVAQAVGVHEGRVRQATAEGAFPAAWFMAMSKLGEAGGVDVPPALFRWKSSQ